MTALPCHASTPVDALLELKPVGKIKGRFVVASYQRGYRWGRDEVTELLDDISKNGEKPYCLQPIVVMPHESGGWELVDGQQRLTTLYLIYRYMQVEGYKRDGAPFSLNYETRERSEEYLQSLDLARSREYIDFHHLHVAFQCIKAWFEAKEEPQLIADDLYRYLARYVHVIWYQAPMGTRATELFTRLNVGRIELTDAELVKALLLTTSGRTAGHTNRTLELATEWDAIERDLRHPERWAFVAHAEIQKTPTHITLLLDTVAGGPRGRGRPRHYTFARWRELLQSDQREQAWHEVVRLHALIMGWYDDGDLYHKIGFLVAVGSQFEDLAELAQDRTKSEFKRLLDQRIRDALKLTPSQVRELSYNNRGHHQQLHHVLLLMNVETVRTIKGSRERYSFHWHGAQPWSLEHIHAQQAETLNTTEQWREWLRLHRDSLRTFPLVEEGTRQELVAEIERRMENIDREGFRLLSAKVVTLFNQLEAVAGPTRHSEHSISNLALLPGAENSALGNSVFEVKRQQIIKFEQQGSYIPICTRYAFLKYYTRPEAQQIHFWSEQDRVDYLDAMISPDRGKVFPYLQPEPTQP